MCFWHKPSLQVLLSIGKETKTWMSMETDLCSHSKCTFQGMWLSFIGRAVAQMTIVTSSVLFQGQQNNKKLFCGLQTIQSPGRLIVHINANRMLIEKQIKPLEKSYK